VSEGWFRLTSDGFLYLEAGVQSFFSLRKEGGRVGVGRSGLGVRMSVKTRVWP
jgi:hypothetical protein